jgi:ADP-ribose pyrophosphatase YjhB (NUDIX family)
MNISQAIAFLEQQIPNPLEGLPDEIFYFISRTTPLVNVDLLIKDENGRTLLSWRSDKYAGQGWHIPGGIVRLKETLEARINKVADTEIGSAINFDPVPIALNQLIHRERDTRAHFISLLYKCYLNASFVPSNKGLALGDRGYLQWHDSCPKTLITYHEMYRSYL